jgi:hypothetical protein
MVCYILIFSVYDANHQFIPAFPPRRSQSQPLDLADPWVGPQTYAEDFYSGGDIREGVLDPALVSPSNLTPVRARSEHTWEEDANGLLPRTPVAVHKETSIIDVDMDEDEKDEDLLNESSPVASSPMGEYNLHQEEYVGREGEHDENDEFRDDEAFDEFLGEEAEGERHTDAGTSRCICIFNFHLGLGLTSLQTLRHLPQRFSLLLNHK